jgi:phage repressor protein C with HTH and peptisase S24 domain
MSDKPERLREARISAGFETAADAAAYLGLATPTYTSHENGSRGITAKKAELYARAFKVSPEWLLYGSGKELPKSAATTPGAEPIAMIPVYDVQASAGDGMMVLTEDAAYMLEFPRGYLQYITKGANPTHLAIIGVRGDSMLPTLADDDIVMLDRSKRDLSQDGLFVIRDNGDALLVKRIGRARTPGHVTVISDNRSLYDPVEKSLDDIEVIGRVIWAGGKV